eukprot:CAMPEP_0206373054 /NCGR_PEP_ID=MMETSP0294-20121207/7480_1 /ASSEMBLY_ACC=CAM_ASM_000327 /TAXON_ID=39354 /ORGANISM="Heterosigma akashiwo, Strain CCMP2393" /LENGTH=865 /DNA_ID=CAMNT_0053820559 /DNA_START=1840 /DNA_END=4437 /DNA_ORIENTATION=+
MPGQLQLGFAAVAAPAAAPNIPANAAQPPPAAPAVVAPQPQAPPQANLPAAGPLPPPPAAANAPQAQPLPQPNVPAQVVPPQPQPPQGRRSTKFWNDQLPLPTNDDADARVPVDFVDGNPDRYAPTDLLNNFDPNWLAEDRRGAELRRWLRFDAAQNKMYCAVCKEVHPHSPGPFVQGTDRWRLRSIYDHQAKHVKHVQTFLQMRAAVAVNQQQQNAIPDHIARMDAQVQAKMVRLFQTANHIGIHDLPFNHFVDQLEYAELVSGNNALFGEAYRNRTQCTNFLGYLARSIETELSSRVHQARFFTLILDCGTLRTGDKVQINFIKFRCPVTHELTIAYAGMDKTDQENADSLFHLARRRLTEILAIPGWQDKMTCLSMDGTNTNIGNNHSIGTLFRAMCTRPLLISWCQPHRLHLAIKGWSSTHPVYGVLKSLAEGIYNLLKWPPHFAQLEASGLALNPTVEVRKVSKPDGAHWITFICTTFEQILHNYRALVLWMQQLRVNANLQMLDNPMRDWVLRADGYFLRLMSYKWVLHLHAFMDVLDCVGGLCKVLQNSKTVAADSNSYFRSSLETLRQMRDEPARSWPPRATEFLARVQVQEGGIVVSYCGMLLNHGNLDDDRAEVKEALRALCDEAIDKITERFSGNRDNMLNEDMEQHMKATSFKDLPPPPRDDEPACTWGDENILGWCQYMFPGDPRMPGNNLSAAEQSHWRAFKRNAYPIRNEDAYVVLERLLRHNVNQEPPYGLVGQALETMMTFGLNSVPCEQGLSYAAQTVTDDRESLEVENVNACMYLKFNRNPRMDVIPAVRMWFAETERRPGSAPTGPHRNPRARRDNPARDQHAQLLIARRTPQPDLMDANTIFFH